MATHTSRTVTKRYYEVVVPCPNGFGAAWVDYAKAATAMRNYVHADMKRTHPEWQQSQPEDLNRRMSDDAVTLHVGDEEIVLRYLLADSD